MMKRIAAISMVSALLMCALAGMGMAEATEVEDTMISEVTVEFVEAIFFYDFTDGGGMDVDFGEQELPKGVATYISAVDGPHTLRVCDRRLAAGGWNVSAKITPMTNETESVTVAMHLNNSSASADITPNFRGTAPSQYIPINQSPDVVMNAAGDLVPGDYDLTTSQEYTQLFIPSSQALLLKPITYTATVTWTLTLAP